MNFLKDIDIKRLGIMVGSIVVVLALGFTTHFLFFRDTEPESGKDVTLEGVEKIVGPGEVNITLQPQESKSILDTPGFSLDIAEKINDQWVDSTQNTKKDNTHEINIESTIDELKKSIGTYGGIFERPEYPIYSLMRESDQVSAHTSNLNDFYIFGQEMTKFPNPQDTLLRAMREQQDGALKTFGTITGNNTQGVYLINDSGFEGSGSMEAYVWGKENIIRITGLVSTSDNDFPNWLLSISVK